MTSTNSGWTRVSFLLRSTIILATVVQDRWSDSSGIEVVNRHLILSAPLEPNQLSARDAYSGTVSGVSAQILPFVSNDSQHVREPEPCAT